MFVSVWTLRLGSGSRVCGPDLSHTHIVFVSVCECMDPVFVSVCECLCVFGSWFLVR